MAQRYLEIIQCPTEGMRHDIFTKPLQGRAFIEVRAELMNFSVDYEYEIICEYAGNTTGVYKTNLCIQIGRINSHYIVYTEATRATIKHPMESPQYFFGGIHIPGFPVRYQITNFLIISGVLHLMEVKVSVWHSYRI